MLGCYSTNLREIGVECAMTAGPIRVLMWPANSLASRKFMQLQNMQPNLYTMVKYSLESVHVYCIFITLLYIHLHGRMFMHR